MLQKITGNKFICMEFVFAICICTFIYTCKPTAFAQIYWKKTVSQVLFKYFNSAFRKAYFSIIKLSLFNQFINFVVVFENTFSSFRLWMNNLVNNASALFLASERWKVFTRYEAYRCKIPPAKKIPTMLLENSDICRHLYLVKFLPPEEILKSWKKQLLDIIAIFSGDCFVETDNGYYSVDRMLLMEHYNYAKLAVLEGLWGKK